MKRTLTLAALAFAALPSTAAAQRSCGWTVQVSGDQANVLFPDDAATYWTGRVPMPAGSHVEIKGRFPYARYTSLTTYNGQYQSIDGIHDAQIVPDAGSSNPYVAGADRTVAKRSYTVKIVNARIPAGGRAPNTLYIENADGSKSNRTTGTASFVLRIYEGDEGKGRTGGVPLPDISLVLATGRRITFPQCPDTRLPDLGLTQTLAAAGPGSSVPASGPGLGGTNPPAWRKFTNFATSAVRLGLDNAVTGGIADAVAPTTDGALPSGGFAENPDNKYVSALYSRDYGQVLEVRAKAPSFPRTREGQPVMGTGQVRYWSLCSNSQTTAFYGCKQDDQVPLDADGFYTFVVSTAAARPRNATEACGRAWLPAGPVPQSILILRNMLPAPAFAEAIQNAEPGAEAQTMGAYYPRGTYFATTADYEAKGC